jgi:hypothetical protein
VVTGFVFITGDIGGDFAMVFDPVLGVVSSLLLLSSSSSSVVVPVCVVPVCVVPVCVLPVCVLPVVAQPLLAVFVLHVAAFSTVHPHVPHAFWQFGRIQNTFLSHSPADAQKQHSSLVSSHSSDSPDPVPGCAPGKLPAGTAPLWWCSW